MVDDRTSTIVKSSRHTRTAVAEGALSGGQLRGWAWFDVTRAKLAGDFGKAFILEGERRTWFNFIPVAFGLGIGAYFAVDREPLWWGPPLAFALCLIGAVRTKSNPVVCAVLIGLAAAAAGLSAAHWRTERVKAPVLDRVVIAKLSGFIESIEERTADARAVVLVTAFGDLAKTATPYRVRVTLPKTTLRPAEHVSVTARLMPPPEAARPGGYDFARDAFFRGYGAVGSGLGVIERVAPPSPPPLLLTINAAIDAARNDMTERIARLIGGQAGAVAAALVTGKRGLISEETNDILRGAGLYHIVSISGLHMVLAAGAIFWLVRAILALIPAIALGWPLKKLAAVLAMIGATAYCIFSGSEVATERSLIMTLVMLGAIVVDRPALSMRNLAISALIVLALEPDAVLGPSFQMSFGAVAALIAFAEWQRRRPRQVAREPGLVARGLRALHLGLGGMVLTSLIAGAATGPFGAFHFQTFNPFGVLGNMMALPFVSLVVMPAAVVGALLYPLGLDALAWWVMGLATEPVLLASRFVAGLGGSTQVIPAYSVAAVLCFGAGLILLALLTTWLRLAAALPLAAGLAIAANPQRVDVYIDREAAGVAARGASGRLVVMGRPGNFVLEQWLKADGDNRKATDPSLRTGAACDSTGCVVTLPSQSTLAWSRHPETVSEDCGRASVVVTPLRWDGACQALMVDRRTLDRFGAVSIRITDKGLVAHTTRNPDSPRPWTRQERILPPSAVPSAPFRAPDEDDVNSAGRD